MIHVSRWMDIRVTSVAIGALTVMARDSLTGYCYTKYSVDRTVNSRNDSAIVYVDDECAYDPREKSWYEGIVESPTWSNIYLFATNELGISYSTPVYVDNVGVVIVQF